MPAAFHGVAKSQTQLNDSIVTTQYENDSARDIFTKGVSKLTQGPSVACLGECVAGLRLECLWPAFGPGYLAAAFVSS